MEKKYKGTRVMYEYTITLGGETQPSPRVYDTAAPRAVLFAHRPTGNNFIHI